MNDRVEIVRFSGGEHDGLVVEAPTHVAARLHAMRFEVLATGRLYDLTEERRIPGARAIGPLEPRPGPVPAAVTAPVAAPSTDLSASAVHEPPTLAASPELPRFADTEPPAPRPPMPPAPMMPLFRSGRPAD